MRESPRSPSVERLRDFYAQMLLIRIVEERLGEMVEAKEVCCPCHLYIGQEAIAVGVCGALGFGDTVWGTHRSHGHYLARGGSLLGLMAEVLGRIDGCSKGRGGSMHLFAPEQGILGTVPIVAGTIPLAVGAGLSSKLRGDESVAVAFFGDGSTEEGHFHESLNLAALYQLPVVFVCENNFYASHLHWSDRRPADNLHKFATIYEIPSVRLDGNDVMAVHEAAIEAVERARVGGGPTFLECRTYRWRGHVGPSWDMDVGVKRRDELNQWLPKCPIQRAKSRLLEFGIGQEDLAQIDAEARKALKQAETLARCSPAPEERELLEHVFCTIGDAGNAGIELRRRNARSVSAASRG
jgi:pyruvate dehydrogenase E1 component alpha subunit